MSFPSSNSLPSDGGERETNNAISPPPEPKPRDSSPEKQTMHPGHPALHRATLPCTPSHRMRGAAAPPRATGRARCLAAPTRAPGAGGTRRDSAPAACHIFVFLFRPFLAAHSNPAGRPSRCPEAGFRDSPNPAGDASPWRSLGFSRALPLRRRCLSVSRWSFADTLLFLLSVHPLRPRPVCNAPGEGGWRCC